MKIIEVLGESENWNVMTAEGDDEAGVSFHFPAGFWLEPQDGRCHHLLRQRLRVTAKFEFSFGQAVPVLPVEYLVGDNMHATHTQTLRSREKFILNM